MAATITNILKVSPGAWRYMWSGTAPYFVYRKGVALLQWTNLTQLIVEGTDDQEPPAIEVQDSTDLDSTVEQLNNPPYATLQWFMAENAQSYVVQQKHTTGGVETWSTIRVLFERGHGYYVVATPILDDVTEHEFRVVAVDAVGNQTAIGFTVFMVRNPDPPRVTMSYSAATGLLTVSAR